MYYLGMIVYRYLTSEELKNILAGDLSKIGSVYNVEVPTNTHKYKKNVRYLHFFKNLRDFPLIQNFAKSPEGKFICKFNIPLRTLRTQMGIGTYDCLRGGYDCDVERVKEFAVEVKKISPDCLVDFIFDEHSDLTVDEIKQIFAEQERQELGE